MRTTSAIENYQRQLSELNAGAGPGVASAAPGGQRIPPLAAGTGPGGAPLPPAVGASPGIGALPTPGTQPHLHQQQSLGGAHTLPPAQHSQFGTSLGQHSQFGALPQRAGGGIPPPVPLGGAPGAGGAPLPPLPAVAGTGVPGAPPTTGGYP